VSETPRHGGQNRRRGQPLLLKHAARQRLYLLCGSIFRVTIVLFEVLLQVYLLELYLLELYLLELYLLEVKFRCRRSTKASQLRAILSYGLCCRSDMKKAKPPLNRRWWIISVRR